MGLTIGTALFGQQPAGAFNARPAVPEHLLYFEDSPRRVRAVFAGRTVADSSRAKLLHETGRVPCYHIPLEDVAADALEPSATVTHCPAKGDATYWTLAVGNRRASDAVWAYELVCCYDERAELEADGGPAGRGSRRSEPEDLNKNSA